MALWLHDIVKYAAARNIQAIEVPETKPKSQSPSKKSTTPAKKTPAKNKLANETDDYSAVRAVLDVLEPAFTEL